MPNTNPSVKVVNSKISELEKQAVEIRELIIQMLVTAGSGHSGGSLSSADILTALYFSILNIKPNDPKDPERDRFVLSNGHICPAFYAVLAIRGFFPKKELWTLRQLGSKLLGHPKYNVLPGIENSSGSLGQGLSIAAGMALAAKIDKKNYRVYALSGDGELQEGQTWEAAMFAPSKNLNNLTWIIDRNGIQIGGFTEDIMPLEKLRAKLEAFNWYVIEIDGHNMEEIVSACGMAKAVTQRPTAIIAHTIPGKGVEFMEYKFEWHGKTPNKEEAKKALTELRTLKGKIKNTYE